MKDINENPEESKSVKSMLWDLIERKKNEIKQEPEISEDNLPIEDDDFDKYLDEFKLIIGSINPLLGRMILKFQTPEEQIMSLFALVTLTGAIMPKVKINYSNKINYPALMTLIIFPPASGKGGLALLRKLLNKINKQLIDEHNDSMRDYQEKLDKYKQSLKSIKPLPLPEKPKMPLIIVPGNITSPKLIEQLSHNGPDHVLTIFETEADAFSINASKGDHSIMNSTILRQAFQNEPVSQMRKTGSELLIAETPKLAVLLSGTENQIARLFHSNEDGLPSRFLVVMGAGSAKWKDVKPNNLGSLDDYFEIQSDIYLDMWKYFQNQEVEVKFTDDQWKQINAFGVEKLAISLHFTGELSSSIAKRHGNMITRIGAILTMLRYFDQKSTSDTAYCEDEDFKIAMWMAERSIEWSLKLYKKLPGKKDYALADNKLKFMRVLPDSFTTKDLDALVPTVPDRTRSRWLKEFVESGLLERLKNGKYEKTVVAKVALVAVSDK